MSLESNFKPDQKQGKKKRKKSEHQLGYNNLMARYLEVTKRDGWKCQNPKCDCPNPYVIDYPHHVKKKSAGRDDRAKNLITLGVHCHDKIHSRGTLKIKGEYPYMVFTYEDGSTSGMSKFF